MDDFRKEMQRLAERQSHLEGAPAPTDRLNPTSPRPRTPPQSTRMPLAAAVRSARCARPGRRSCPSNSFDSPAPLLPIIPLGKEAAGPLHFEEGRRAAVSASDEFQRECDLNHRAPLGGVRDCCAEFAVSSPYHFAPGPSLGGEWEFVSSGNDACRQSGKRRFVRRPAWRPAGAARGDTRRREREGRNIRPSREHLPPVGGVRPGLATRRRTRLFR